MKKNFARCGRAAAAVAATLVPCRSSLAVLWNATDTSYSAINTTGGLTDNYGQFVNSSVITNTGGGFYGTATYLNSGWFLTVRHVVQNGGDYNTIGNPAVMQVNVYGQNYYGDQIVDFGSADVALIHVGGYTGGQITTLPGVDRRQVAGAGSGLAQIAGFGLNGIFGSTPVNNATFHRAFNTPYVSGVFLNINANQNTRLINDGYLLGVQQGGDSGSGMWESNGPSDQDLDLYDWSLTGVCQTGGGTTLGNAGGGYGFLQAYAGTILATVYPHAALTWNANAANTSTATDGPGVLNATNANFTDGTNFALNGPERTEQAIFGAGNGAAGTVTLGSTVAVSDLVFNAAGSGTYNIAGGAGTSLSLRASSRITTNVDATISANITGGGANGLHGFNSFPTFARLAKLGAGTLTLTGNTTLDGGTAFYAREGTTVVAGGGSFTPGFYTSVAVYSGETATLTLKDNAVYNSANQDFNLADLGGTGTLNVQGNAALTAGVLYVGKGTTRTQNNSTQPISAGGVGVVNQTGGTVTANAVSLGSFNLVSAGTYNLNGGALRTNGITRGTGVGNINFNGGTLVATAANTALLTGLSSATVNTGGATINTNGFNVTVGQPIAHAGTGVDGGLTKTGTGVLTFTGGSTYTGNTTIAGGTLRLGSTSAVATYSFDNVSGTTVVNDGTGGAAMNGTLANGAVIAAAAGGRAGNAVSLSNGASVDINSPITDLASAGNWTVSAWVKTTVAGSSILSKGDGTGWNYGNTILYLGDGTAGGSGGIPSSVRYAGGFFQGSTAATPVTDGTWHQVTYVNSGGVYAIYTDGVVQPLSAGNTGFGVVDVGTAVRLGISTDTFAGDGAGNFNGLLDGVQFYGQALTAGQVSGLLQGVNVGPLPTTTGVTIAAGAGFDLNGTVQQIASLTGSAGSAVTLGSGQLIVNGPASTVFSGTLSGTGGLTKAGTGTVTLASGVTTGYNVIKVGPVIVNGGTLSLGTTGATANHTVLGTPALTLSGGRLDIGKGDADLPGASLSAITSLAATGFNNGASGIVSTAAAADSNHTTAVAVVTAGQVGRTAFDGMNVGGTDVLVKYAYFGDANIDGKVDGGDYTLIDNGFLTAGSTGWYNGDFNYDNKVDGSDYSLIDNAYNRQAATLTSAALTVSPTALTASVGSSTVPEPAMFSLIGLAAAGLLGRRRR